MSTLKPYTNTEPMESFNIDNEKNNKKKEFNRGQINSLVSTNIRPEFSDEL